MSVGIFSLYLKFCVQGPVDTYVKTLKDYSPDETYLKFKISG